MRCCDKENWGIRLKPIFCDNHLLILNKPGNVATQPDFHEAARVWVKDHFGKPGNVFLEPVHRLDRPASGLVLFARTSKALSRLNEAMRQRKLRKTYLAIVEGHVQEEGTLEHLLIHGDFKAYVDPNGKQAILRFHRLKISATHSLVEIELETGRYHQIRAQFAAIGHPISGDRKYGSTEDRPQIALHHHRLILEHPTTKEVLTFQCPASFSSL
ncbi:MAG: RNA pseudouridine synthase [Verrucomicrobia bacterium]|nr:RNA pseudouridine synthase [Verrucomicrobiota bacterium]